jgi:hypothetical protein
MTTSCRSSDMDAIRSMWKAMESTSGFRSRKDTVSRELRHASHGTCKRESQFVDIV